jgi:RNA polymerase primary sigma factor
MAMQAYDESPPPPDTLLDHEPTEVIEPVVDKQETLAYQAVVSSDRLEAARQRRHARMQGSKAPDRADELPDATRLYLQEIGAIPVLTAEEEVELYHIMQAGRQAQEKIDSGQKSDELQDAVDSGRQAKARFIRSNLRLVVSIAKTYPILSNMEFLDLIQDGNLGLEHVVDLFDGTKGYKFSTYATSTIRQYIGRGIDRKAHLIRLPVELSPKLRNALKDQSMQPGDETGDDLEGNVGKAYRMTTPVSLNKLLDGTRIELGDTFVSPSAEPAELLAQHAGTVDLYKAIETAFQRLSPKQRRAIELRHFGIGSYDDEDDTKSHDTSYRIIGEQMNGITDKAARGLVIRGLELIREDLDKQGMLDNRGEL